MMILRSILALLAASLLLAAVASAHDFEAIAERDGRAVIVRAVYGGTDPAAYAAVLIYAPAGGEIEFQNGRTDAKGLFAFVPDRSGDWRFVIDDEEGHRAEILIPVQLDETAETAPQVMPGVSTAQKALTGVSLIIGLTGLLFWWKARTGTS